MSIYTPELRRRLTEAMRQRPMPTHKELMPMLGLTRNQVMYAFARWPDIPRAPRGWRPDRHRRSAPKSRSPVPARESYADAMLAMQEVCADRDLSFMGEMETLIRGWLHDPPQGDPA